MSNSATPVETTSLPEADLAQVHWWLEQLEKGRHPGGVIALAAQPVWTDPPVIELRDGTRAAIRLASSVLAIRDALTARAEFDWVVILTDRPAAELPTGVLEHLLPDCRLHDLNPWPALRSRFRAARQEFTLLAPSGGGSGSAMARAVLRELGPDDDKHPLPPAPGGVLTNDHLFTVLTKRALGMSGEVAAHQIAVWSMDTANAERFDRWMNAADPELSAKLLDWMAGKIGRLGELFTAVLRAGGPADIVPLGLVAALLDDTAGTAAAFPAPSEVLVRTRTLLEVHLGGHQLTEEKLVAWGNVATLAATDGLVGDDVLRRTETLVRDLRATSLVGRSEVLPAGLTPRISRLADALNDSGATPDTAQRSAVEGAWADLLAHNEARADTRWAPRDVRVAGAAVRLWRWQPKSVDTPGGLSDWINYYRQELAWVDGAVNDAFTGAHDPQLARFADAVVTAVRARRAEQDRVFARLLAGSGAHRETGANAPLYVEDVLDRVIAPLTAPRPLALSDQLARTPVLVVIADGMSAAVAGEVIADALRRHRPQWQECRFTEDDTSATLAALPTLTEFSRCSLLSGELKRGTAHQETRGFTAWLASHGMPPTGQTLFHKGDLDAVSRGNALAADVRAAVEDTRERPVVACVLNDIDDALDRSDPIGTTWDVASFKHLDPLLKAAATVGRIVVLLSDHGHVPERREQLSVQRGQQISARYRLADGVEESTLPADEVLVDGPRVLSDGNRAVLAVDEQVRYTGMKAGYHGGASPAEAVIPISILVNGAVPADLGLEPAPSAPPTWWFPEPASASPPITRPLPITNQKNKVRPGSQPATLFDTETLAPVHDSPKGAGGVRDLVDELLRSPLFSQQFATFGRNLKKPQLGTLLREVIAAGGVLPMVTTARLLGVKATRVSGAVSVVAQVLNTDGVEVVSVQGTDLLLNQALLFEQFGVTAPGARP